MLDIDTHQLERLIEKLENCDSDNDGLNPTICKLKSLLNVSRQINELSGRLNNTTRIVLSGETLEVISEVLGKTAQNKKLERDKRILHLHFMGVEESEIARILGCDLETVNRVINY